MKNVTKEAAQAALNKILSAGQTRENVDLVQRMLRCEAVAEMVVEKVHSGHMRSRETYALARAALNLPPEQ